MDITGTISYAASDDKVNIMNIELHSFADDISVPVDFFVHNSDVIMIATVFQITGFSIVYSAVCWGVDQRKYQIFASLAFVRGINRWPVDSPHKGPVTRKMFPFDDVIMKRGVIRIVADISGAYLAYAEWHGNQSNISIGHIDEQVTFFQWSIDSLHKGRLSRNHFRAITSPRGQYTESMLFVVVGDKPL